MNRIKLAILCAAFFGVVLGVVVAELRQDVEPQGLIYWIPEGGGLP